MTRTLLCAGLHLVLLLAASPAFAQGSPAVDLSVGWAGFVDDRTIPHTAVGGALRFYVSPRLSIGPEVVYMRGPGFDRDLFVTGNVTFDFRSDRRFTPYVVAGGGVMRHSNRFARGPYSSIEGALTAGGGVRLALSERWSAGVETRLGWEAHLRVSGSVSARLQK
jgi:hypothetical protein